MQISWAEDEPEKAEIQILLYQSKRNWQTNDKEGFGVFHGWFHTWISSFLQTLSDLEIEKLWIKRTEYHPFHFQILHLSLSYFQSESNMNGEKSMNIIASSNLHKPQIKEILGAAIISYSFQASGLDSCAFEKMLSNFALDCILHWLENFIIRLETFVLTISNKIT